MDQAFRQALGIWRRMRHGQFWEEFKGFKELVSPEG